MITFLLAIALLCVIASQLNTNVLYIFIFTIAAFTIGGMTAVQITALSLLVWLSIEVAIYYAAWLRKHVGWIKCQQGLVVAVRF
mgnify:FL=1